MNDLRALLDTKLVKALSWALAILGAYLLWSHTGHVISALPYLILLLCPLMHVFGHRHEHGSGKQREQRNG